MVRSFGPAVIIGLGGTGQKALIRIKKLFLEHCGLIPPCIKLLVFDTTSNRESVFGPSGEAIRFSDSEFCHMSVGSVAEAIRNQFVQKWWIPYDPINRTSVSHGTGGIREVGRLATFANIDTIEALLASAFEQVNAFGLKDEMRKLGLEMLETTPQVFVVGSLAGGTGSGSFVDFSVLCRHLSGRNMFYTAFFVMPWIFRDVAKTCFENGYAALLELEKLNGASPENPYSVEYTSTLKPMLEERPYHIVNLIDGQCRNEQWILSRDELPAFVGESIFTSIGGVAAKYRDIVDNIMTMITLALSPENRSQWEGQQAVYSTTGVSAIVYPAPKIHERLKASYAAGLIDHALKFITGKQTSPRVGSEVVAFLNQHKLTTDAAGLLDKILPMPRLAYLFDDRRLGLNLRDRDAKNRLVRVLDKWCEAQKKPWKLDERADDVRKGVSRAVAEFLAKIRQYEEARDADFPEGSYIEGNELLAAHWKTAIELFTTEQSELREGRDKLQHDVDVSREEVGKRIPDRIWASTNPVRNACKDYCDSFVKLLEHDLKMDRLSAAARVCGVWRDEAMAHEKEFQRRREESKKVADELAELKQRLESQVSRLSVANMLKQKAMFEILVGVKETHNEQTDAITDHLCVREESRDPKSVAASDFDEFRTRHGLNEPKAFNQLSSRDREKMLLDFADDKMRPATDQSVLHVLKQMREEDADVIERLTEQAIRYSSQLLPINENALAGRRKLLAEFTAVGGVSDDEEIKQAICACVPQSPLVQNVWANTGDRYRLTFANYFSVIPLYVLNGIEGVREHYLMRVRPPAHTDRQFEFPLVDILPANSAQIEVLKLLSLATLKSTGLIQRLPLPQRIGDSHFYYRLNPELFRVVDSNDLVLPGTPGKFYSLYEQLCRESRASLRKNLRQALLDLANRDGFAADQVLAEIQQTYNEFRQILEEKEFNKMITGMLYRQQMAYFHKLLQLGRQEFSIQKALDIGLSFRANK